MSLKNKKFISFYLADQLYALPVSSSNKFIELSKVSKVPAVDNNVCGLIYHNGNIITVIDIKKILKIKLIKDNHQKIGLLFEKDKYYYAIVVDQGSDIVSATRIYTDKQNKNFNKYIKNKVKGKIYVMNAQEILSHIKIYD